MKATMAVMTRELVARREIVLAAVAAAVIASLMPMMPGLDSYQPDDVRAVSSNTLAVALGWGLALLFGATVIGGDLKEGRLGFFFSRPVSGFAVWWGRMLAVLLLIWVCEAIVLVPSLFGDGVSVLVSSRNWGWPAVVGYLVLPLLLLLFAHAAGIMVRARTAWLFLDLAGLVAFAAIVWVTLLPFLSVLAEIALWVMAGALVSALVISLAVGGVVGVMVGRVDLRRTHAALSLGLWSTLALCLAGITLYASWLRDFGPSDFADVEVLTVDPNGRWVEVVGGAPKRLDVKRRCLVSTSDNRWLSLPGGAVSFWREVVYSRDGSTAVWLGAGLGDKPRALLWADFGRPDPSARSSNLVVSPDAVFVLSTDGARVAILEEGTLSAYELDDERLLTAVRLPENLQMGSMLFESPNTLRIFARTGEDDGHSLLIAEVDSTSGEFALTGEIEGLPEESWFITESSLAHLVMWTRSKALEKRVYSVYDGRSGAFIEDLDGSGFRSFLADGRMVVLQRDGDGTATLEVGPIGGDEPLVYELQAGEDARISGEAVPGGVVITRFEDPSERTQGKHFELFDVDTGVSRLIGRNLSRSVPWVRWLQGHTRGILWFGNRPATSRLLIDQTGALVRWDPETGELAHVVGGRD